MRITSRRIVIRGHMSMMSERILPELGLVFCETRLPKSPKHRIREISNRNLALHGLVDRLELTWILSPW